MHWRYETLDLAPHLRAGPQRARGARLELGSGATGGAVQPPHGLPPAGRQRARGRGQHRPGVEGAPQHRLRADPGPHRGLLRVASRGGGGRPTACRGGGKQVDYSDDTWKAVAAGEGWRADRTQLRGTDLTGQAGGWQLVPRSLPPMEEKPVRFARVRRAQGIEPGDGFLRGTGDLVVPARSRAVLLLDQSHLTNAYAVLETSGGAGSTISLTYAEALKDAAGPEGEPRRDRGQDDRRGQGRVPSRRRRAAPLPDALVPHLPVRPGRDRDGRTQPLRVHDLHGIFTAYPFELRAQLRQRPAVARRTCGRSTGAERACAPSRPTSTRPTTSSSSTSATRASRP